MGFIILGGKSGGLFMLRRMITVLPLQLLDLGRHFGVHHMVGRVGVCSLCKMIAVLRLQLLYLGRHCGVYHTGWEEWGFAHAA